MTKAELKARLTDTQAVYLTAWAEARADGGEGMLAVCCVIRTRRDHPRWWGRAWKGVVFQPWQFSCWHPEGGAANYRRLQVAAFDVLRNEPSTLAREKPLQIAHMTAVLVMKAENFMAIDVTHGADHYHHASVKPRWAFDRFGERYRTPVARIKDHLFYRLEVKLDHPAVLAA